MQYLPDRRESCLAELLEPGQTGPREMEKIMFISVNFTKSLAKLLAISVVLAACTKSREASLPDDAQENNFAITELDTLQSAQQYSIKTDSQLSELSLGQSAKATAEKGLVRIEETTVPKRLQFMFKGLEISAQTNKQYPVVLTADKKFVTVYKIVSDFTELSLLEQQIAVLKDEVVAQQKIQRAGDNKTISAAMREMKKVQENRAKSISQAKEIFVPLFKYKVEKYGILERTKNELKETTSTLRLKVTDWSVATHINMSTNPADRVLVGLDPATRGDMDRTFVMNKINNKIMTAETLKNEFQVSLNLQDSSTVLTLLDVDVLHVYEITQVGKTPLTDVQAQQLKNPTASSTVKYCSEDIKKALPAAARENCILVLRYDVPVSYVKAELPPVDYEGNQDAKITFRKIRASEAGGLVQIEQNVEAVKVEGTGELDPRRTLRIADIKNKEFFFKRTLEDAPATTMFPPGMAGNLTIVKFELEESRLVVKKADKLVHFKSGSNETDYEELMSFPVKYFKLEKRNATGAQYAVARIVPSSRAEAEYIEVDWVQNTLRAVYSPYESLHKSCISSVADANVSDMDLRMEQGVLNFSISYSTSLNLACVAQYNFVNDYNGTASYQVSARLKERVSFKVNDGKTDKIYVPQIPFKTQNELGYGVWTIAQLNPTDTGLTGREGQELNYPVVHDFRNGKKLLYTVTGLEPEVDLPQEIRDLYKEVTHDVINSWDLAYRQAFKGTAFERSGRYVEVQFAGENGVTAKIGDLDKNIVHYENKFNDNHGILGVSQVGFNPRSGIVVADSLVVYAGNLQQYVAAMQRSARIAKEWADKKAEFKKQALAQLAAQNQAAAKVQAGGQANDGEKAQAANHMTGEMLKMLKGGQAIDTRAFTQAKSLRINHQDIQRSMETYKALGVKNFEYASPTRNYGWIDSAMKKFIDNSTMDGVQLQGIIAEEMLKFDKSLSLNQKNELTKAVKMGQFRTQLHTHLANKPGCMFTGQDDLVRDFANKTYIEALRGALYFDLAHEMGHSQGLTHNFIASYDKANFKNQDGSDSKRNYSSVMDYIPPSKFSWDGIGSYDVHALRASHLGLLEASPAAIESFKKQGTDGKLLSQGKFIHVNAIKENFAKNGWNNFTSRQVQTLLKPYKYCTDVHVGYEPICQRFDTGTTPQEIVADIIKDYETAYVNNYHSWDRNNFTVRNMSAALGGTMMRMMQIRQFMDETYYTYFYSNSPQKQQDFSNYLQAGVKAYLFYNQVIRTPDANLPFMSSDRFVALPYNYESKDESGNTYLHQDIEIIEKKAISNLSMSEHRLDTIGTENDKIMAMNFLTMKSYPAYKYRSNSMSFSFLDFEKHFLGMNETSSLFVNTVTEMMLDKLGTAFTNEKVSLSSTPLSATVTQAMRAYAGIYGILNLEASTLKDTDNFATFFKVASSFGEGPGDRIALSPLGAQQGSKSRLKYWAIDNAVAAQNVITDSAQMDFLIQSTPALSQAMKKLTTAQIKELLNGKAENQADESVKTEVTLAKEELLKTMTQLNQHGDLASEEMVKSNPKLSLEGQVEMMAQLSAQSVNMAILILNGNQEAQQAAARMNQQLSTIVEALPVFNILNQTVRDSLTEFGEIVSKQKGLEKFAQMGDVVRFIPSNSMELKYGIIMKNIEFLSSLTIMTNPEYNR